MSKLACQDCESKDNLFSHPTCPERCLLPTCRVCTTRCHPCNNYHVNAVWLGKMAQKVADCKEQANKEGINSWEDIKARFSGEPYLFHPVAHSIFLTLPR